MDTTAARSSDSTGVSRRHFLKTVGYGAGALFLPFHFTAEGNPPAARPNIVLIMSDDMGYSDLGCYGGEIPTPNLDALAAKGLRFTQFYNTARCSPTRASLLTGLHPHQAGMGILAEDPGQRAAPDAAPGYTRFLNRQCITLAEALKPAGYHTYISGKWHLGYHGQEKWPLQRGFDRFYGLIAGASCYFRPTDPRGLTLDNDPLSPPAKAASTPENPTFYITDAFTDYALSFIRDQKDDAPFFLYLPYTAPHWPLHARQEDVDKFVGTYREGWDALRQRRYMRMIELGVVSKDWALSARDDGARAWESLTEQQKTDLDYRMAVYAAQIHRMDWNIGRVVQTLRDLGKLDNTLILYLHDNGGCAEPYHDLGGGDIAAVNLPGAIWSGGRNAQGMDGSAYGTGWANASNTPFRRFKSMLHEGGIATPLIAHWPKGLKTKPGAMVDAVGYLADIMPTALEAAGATYPESYQGHTLHPLAGQSLMPVFQTGTRPDPEWLFWEQYNNRAVRHGKWKAVRPAGAEKWELYDLQQDRSEVNDLANEHPDLLATLTAAWDRWARSHQVLPKTSRNS